MLIPVFDVGRIVQMVKNTAFDVAKFIALRALLISICVTLVPLAIFAGWSLIISKIFELVNTETTGAFSGTVIQLSGMGAWIGQQMYIGQALSIFFAALALKFTLSFFRR
ncbi:MAG: hypothetical protein GY870_16965 [archaeon]|nr:hypothetical protein [archaeon]